MAEVVECTVDLENQNLPFGPVAGGSLILRASILPCRWLIHVDKHGGTCYELLVKFPALSLRACDASITVTTHPCCEADLQLEKMWFIPLVHKLDPGPTQGLVVTRAEKSDVGHRARAGTQSGRDVYRRVAVANCEAEYWDAPRMLVQDILAQLPRVNIELV